jgi:hypothetical protein
MSQSIITGMLDRLRRAFVRPVQSGDLSARLRSLLIELGAPIPTDSSCPPLETSWRERIHRLQLHTDHIFVLRHDLQDSIRLLLASLADESRGTYFKDDTFFRLDSGLPMAQLIDKEVTILLIISYVTNPRQR